MNTRNSKPSAASDKSEEQSFSRNRGTPLVIVLAVVIGMTFLFLYLDKDIIGTGGPSREDILNELAWVPSSADIVFLEDSHGGMHGEGRTFLSFRCEDVTFRKFHQGIAWEPQPLPQNVVSLFRSSSRLFHTPSDQAPPLHVKELEFHQKSNHEMFLCMPTKRVVWYVSVTW